MFLFVVAFSPGGFCFGDVILMFCSFRLLMSFVEAGCLRFQLQAFVGVFALVFCLFVDAFLFFWLVLTWWFALSFFVCCLGGLCCLICLGGGVGVFDFCFVHFSPGFGLRISLRDIDSVSSGCSFLGFLYP